ncbi:MAG: pentapeptide repeat-containing protein [Pseudomonadota bacterium]
MPTVPPPSAQEPSLAPPDARERIAAARLAFAEGVGSGLKARLGSEHAWILREIFVNRALDGWRFDGEDLRDVDFTGASLDGATFVDAQIEGARFDCAFVERRALRRAADWHEHVRGWTPPRRKPPTPHRPGALFSEAPFAPEFVMAPHPSQWTAVGHPETARWIDDLDPQERAALDQGRLAISATFLVPSEVSARRGRRLDRVAESTKALGFTSGRNALDVMDAISDRVGVTFRLPSLALWRLAAADCLPMVVNTSAAPAELNLPARMPRLAQGVRNRWGLWDLAGVLRTLVVHRDGLAHVGGCWRESRVRPTDRATAIGRQDDVSDLGLRLVRIFDSDPWEATPK